MNIPFLKKYQPQTFKDFIIDGDYIDILNTMITMDNLNIHHMLVFCSSFVFKNRGVFVEISYETH